MIGYVLVKHALKWSAGRASVCLAPCLRGPAAARACIFTYHRVNAGERDLSVDAWNVTPARFEAQARALAAHAEVVPLASLRDRLLQAPGPRPLVCLTFDDAYACVRHEALPVLQRYGLPATVFLVTQYVGSAGPMPFDRWGARHSRPAFHGAWRPMDWAEVDACVASGLVTIGAHSARHLDARRCGHEDLVEEAQRSREDLLARLGDAHAFAYAYPYGCRRLGWVPESYIEAVRRAGYSIGLTTDLDLATASADRLALPRVEACGQDSPAALLAKARGALAPQRFTDRLRASRRWRAPGDAAPGAAGRGSRWKEEHAR